MRLPAIAGVFEELALKAAKADVLYKVKVRAAKAGDWRFRVWLSSDHMPQPIYEDESTLAFMDIHPLSPGHCLVIPKAHAATLFEVEPDDLRDELILRLGQARTKDRYFSDRRHGVPPV